MKFLTFAFVINILTLEHCGKIKFSIYVHQTLMNTKCEQCYA